VNYAVLTEVLRQQAAAMVQLQQLLEQGRQALVENEPYRLEEIERKKVLTQQELQFLEEKRTGLCPAGKTLSAIAGAAPPEYKHQLAGLLEKLRRLATGLQEANTLNRLLLEQSLAYVQLMQQALQPGRGTFYGRGGKLAQEDLVAVPLTRLLDETA